MGGGGGGTFSGRTPSQLGEMVRRAENEASSGDFELRLSEKLASLLAQFNGRDAVLTKSRLEDIKSCLGDEIDRTVDHLYGGSVAKHTYVDGLSDIDSLLILKKGDFRSSDPSKILGEIESILKQRLPGDVKISHGRMAVTIDYADGMKIQVLPALHSGEGLKIPSSRNAGWSDVDSAGFDAALTRRNAECGGKLVPTIKLAKAIIGTLPEEQRLSGYHVESLAIDAFRKYSGKQTTAAMLPYFFERAKDAVLSPIKDSSGQSIHLDGYLGAAGSDLRVTASHILSRIGKRMKNASAAKSLDQWGALFESDY